MIDLPDITALVRRTQALAALDLILSPEWESRYYSFNTAWAPGQQMASMRDGCGGEWWLLFHADGWAALKGLEPDSEAWAEGGVELSAALRSAIPSICAEFADEPAFRWDETGFAYFRLPGAAWVRANEQTRFAKLATGEIELLQHLGQPAEAYVTYARDYYETEVPLELVQAIYRHDAITAEMIATLNAETTLAEIEAELYGEIGYPRG